MKGIVIKATGSSYKILAKDNQKYICKIRGNLKLAKTKAHNLIAIGDHIEFEIENDKTLLGHITSIYDRKNYIIRKSTGKHQKIHVVAANVDKLFLMVTLNAPTTTSEFIDNFLVTAEAYHIESILLFNKADILNKADLKEVKTLINTYSDIGYKCLLFSAKKSNKKDIDDLILMMANSISVVAGLSGVGKTTLLNLLLPHKNLKTAPVSHYNQKGIHTTTYAEMYQKNSGFIIDTPGINSFGLVEISKKELSYYFPEMKALLNQCKFDNCLHLDEPGCIVKESVKSGKIALSRYKSYTKMLKSV